VTESRIIPVPLLVGLQGMIKVELIDAKTGRVKWKSKFPNLITNAGKDLIGVGALNNIVFNSTSWCAVGLGSTAPANTDTTLVSETSTRTNDNGGFATSADAYTAGPPDYHERSRVYLFSTAQANGNLTEIGIFDASTGGNMWMRQLLKDGGGTPTTIVKTSAEQLRITYYLRVQPLQSDVSITRVISGVSYDIVIRATQADNANNWGLAPLNFGTWPTTQAFAYETQTLGARTSFPAGTASQCNSTSAAAYSNGNYYRDVTWIWGAGVGNFTLGIGAISCLCMNNGATLFQMNFTPRIAKDNVKELTLVTRFSWDRV